MKKFNTLRLDLAEKTLTPAEKKKREEIAMAMERENPGMPMAKKMAIATATAKRVAEENLDEISTKLLAKAAHSAADPMKHYDDDEKFHDPQKFADHAKKTKDAKSAAAVQGAADAKGHYTRPGHTLGSYDKLAHRTPARVTSAGKANKQDVKTLKGSIKRNEEITYIDELKTDTLDSYITKVATGPSRGNTQTGIPKSIKAIGGVTTAIRKKAEQMKEEIETTHEDPLVVTRDSDGNIHTHANLSVANAIHGTDVKHQAIHTGMPVQAGKFTFELSKHHASAVKEAKEKTEYDYEGDMARGQLQSIIMNAQRVHDMLKDNDNLPEWVQSKITLAEDYISTVSNYMSSEIDEDKDPCWDNYKQFGMKKGKNGKPVPDCRGPVKEDSIDELTLSFGKKAKPTVSARISDMKKYFDTADKDQVKQKITGKKFHDMSEYETWMKSNKSKGSMQVASFEQGDENKLDEISSNTLHSYMKAAHTKYSNIDHKNDPASVAKKNKLEKGIKTAYNKKYPSKTSKPEDKVDMSSASSYYASKKPGQYTGD